MVEILGVVVFLSIPSTIKAQEVLPDPSDVIADDNDPPVPGAPGQPAATVAPGTAGTPIPVQAKISSSVLSPESIRTTVTDQVRKFRAFATDKTLYLPWPQVVTQSGRGKVIGSQEVEYRYRMEKQKVPRYEYEYKPYEAYVQVPATASEYETRMITKKISTTRVKTCKVVGYDTKEVKVVDPSGPITEKAQIPIYENLDIFNLDHGWFGTNALTLFSMLESGLPPADPKFRQSLDSLSNSLIAYGIPDRTWDIAWLTALYANVPQNNAVDHDLTAKLVSRLLGGAIQDGP